jgi:ankyrin repeat protein
MRNKNDKIHIIRDNQMSSDMCHFLLLIGANKDAKDSYGNTPFDIAIKA